MEPVKFTDDVVFREPIVFDLGSRKKKTSLGRGTGEIRESRTMSQALLN